MPQVTEYSSRVENVLPLLVVLLWPVDVLLPDALKTAFLLRLQGADSHEEV